MNFAVIETSGVHSEVLPSSIILLNMLGAKLISVFTGHHGGMFGIEPVAERMYPNISIKWHYNLVNFHKKQFDVVLFQSPEYWSATTLNRYVAKARSATILFGCVNSKEPLCSIGVTSRLHLFLRTWER